MIVMISITIPIPQKVSTNDIYAGMHWSKRKKLADLYHRSLIEYRNSPKVQYPVEISYVFSFKGRLLDCDNCSYMAKLLKDGLRHWQIITDDSPQYVSSVTLVSQKGKKEEVQIIIV